MYYYHFRGIPLQDIPLLNTEVQALLNENCLDVENYDEIVAVRRKDLISELKELGNRKMLKGVRSIKHDCYFLLLNSDTKRLKIIGLPRRPEYNREIIYVYELAVRVLFRHYRKQESKN